LVEGEILRSAQNDKGGGIADTSKHMDVFGNDNNPLDVPFLKTNRRLAKRNAGHEVREESISEVMLVESLTSNVFLNRESTIQSQEALKLEQVLTHLLSLECQSPTIKNVLAWKG